MFRYTCCQVTSAAQQSISIMRPCCSPDCSQAEVLGLWELHRQHAFWRILIQVRNKLNFYNKLYKTVIAQASLEAVHLKNSDLLESQAVYLRRVFVTKFEAGTVVGFLTLPRLTTLLGRKQLSHSKLSHSCPVSYGT